jgi:hypothetical protein
MNVTEDTIQVPGHMLVGYAHSVSEGLIDKQTQQLTGNRTALKGMVSKEIR